VRLWTVHPQYLDARGLTAAWREALLAQRVLSGATRGYLHHPQLIRFRSAPNPLAAIAVFLSAIHQEASRRGYRFNRHLIEHDGACGQIDETDGQLLVEWGHLLHKLERRDPERLAQLRGLVRPAAHPLFRIVPGPVRDWEKLGGV